MMLVLSGMLAVVKRLAVYNGVREELSLRMITGGFHGF